MCARVLEKPEIFRAGPPVYYLACSFAKNYRWFYNGDSIRGEIASVYVPGDNPGSYFVKISENKFCWTSSDTVTIPPIESETLSDDSFNQVELYPNPSKGTINVQMHNALKGELHIEIFTIQGSKVYGRSFHKETSLFFRQLEFYELVPGIYFISMQIGDARLEQRLLID